MLACVSTLHGSILQIRRAAAYAISSRITALFVDHNICYGYHHVQIPHFIIFLETPPAA